MYFYMNVVFTDMNSPNICNIESLELFLEFHRSQILCLFVHFKWPQKLYRDYLAHEVFLKEGGC